MLFYRYVKLNRGELKEIKDALESAMAALSITCKIRLSEEGINATCAGLTINVQSFEKKLKCLDESENVDIFRKLDLKGVDMKWQNENGCMHVFPNVSVRIVDELCPFERNDRKINKSERVQIEEAEKAARLSPTEWREELLCADEEDIILDVRNFKGSLE